jgi:DNA-directed RNA polymerases I, II, and III subunit RPABC3
MSGDIELLNFRGSVDNMNDEKYDRVARVDGKEITGGAIYYQLDVNTDIWPVSVGDELTITLASSLNLDGSKDDGKGWRDANKGEATLADDYDYVCHGKIYRFEEGNEAEM